MRLLVDNALSPRVATLLREAGHDVAHARDVGLAAASDDVLFQIATRQDRVILSADTDFGTLLVLRESRKPSVVLWRAREHHPDTTANL